MQKRLFFPSTNISAPLCWGTPLGITALRKKARFIPSVTHLCQLPLLPDEPFLTDEGLVHELSHLSGCCFTFLPSPCFTASASTLRFWPTHSQPPVVPQPPTTLPQESWGSTCHTTLIAQKYNGLQPGLPLIYFYSFQSLLQLSSYTLKRQFVHTVYSHAYMIPGTKLFRVCAIFLWQYISLPSASHWATVS